MMLDRTVEFREIAGVPKDALKQLHIDAVPEDAFSVAARNIVSRCVEFEKVLSDHIWQLNSLKCTVEPYALFSVKTGAWDCLPCKAVLVSEKLRNNIKSLHHDIKQLELQLKNGNLSNALESHRRGVIAYLFDRVLRSSSMFQDVESARVVRENNLKKYLMPSSSGTVNNRSGASSLLVALPLAPTAPQDWCFAFVPAHWLKELKATPSASLTSSSHKPPNALRPADAYAKPQQQLSARTSPSYGAARSQAASTDADRHTMTLERPTSTAVFDVDATDSAAADGSSRDFATSLYAEQQQLQRAQEQAQAEHAPITQVLNTLADLQSIMDVFSTEVLNQTEMCENINTTAEASVANIVAASKELSKAVDRQRSSYRYYTIVFYLSASLALLCCDFFMSSRWI